MSNFEKGTSRLGIDVGNVISDHQDNDPGENDENAYFGDMAEAMAQRSPTLECAYACRALADHFGPENTFILSKCRTRMQLATVQMLSNPIEGTENENFFDITGLVKRNVIFCTKASGGTESEGSKKQKLRLVPLYPQNTTGPRVAEGEAGKGAVARVLHLTHMIDDRHDCLLSFALEGHLISLTSLKRSVKPSVPQRGCLLQFWKEEPPTIPTSKMVADFVQSHHVLKVTKKKTAQIQKQVEDIEQWLISMWKPVRGWQEVLGTLIIVPQQEEEEQVATENLETQGEGAPQIADRTEKGN